MKAADFDEKFDRGEEDIIDDLDLSQMRRPGHLQQQVSVDFPVWMIESLDREASRLGITRQAVIKFWIAEHIKHAHS
ncbi:MAG: CopG family transcriptional regulator [Cyanobacteria bacterium J06614_10]